MLAPKMADYVKEMEVYDWMVSWDDPPQEERGEIFFGASSLLRQLPYPGPMVKVFEDAVRDTKSIPSKEKEHWISSVQAGDQDPVIALIFP